MRFLAGVALFLATTALYLQDLDRPFGNSDEVIYAQFAREMAASGRWSTLTWQGRPVLNRPPASVWPLALAVRLGAGSEAGLRTVVALEAALVVWLLFLLGARRYGPRVGLTAAMLLAAADRYHHYAGFIESEPLLLIFVLGAVLAWEKSRTAPRWTVAWGALLGWALLTKQIVGGLPLLWPLLDWATGRPPPGRALLRGLAVAALTALPWHLVHWIEYGAQFPRAFLGTYVVLRLVEPLHRGSTAGFYFTMLWQREGPLILVAGAGLIYGLLRRDLVPTAWVLATLGPFSAASSRYDYYALLAYPALLLAAARLVVETARGVLAIPLVVAWALLHLGSGTARLPPQDIETTYLAQAVARASRAQDVLLVVDQLPYAARYYAGRRTIQLVLSRAELDRTRRVLPAEVVFAPDLLRAFRRYRRWFAIVPRVHLGRLRGLGWVFQVAATPRYLLLTNVPRPRA